MKKTLLLMLAVLFASAAQAQVRGGAASRTADDDDGESTSSRNSGIGIKGGLTLGDVVGSGSNIFTNRENINTYHAGIYLQQAFNRFFSLQVEALYSRKGFRADSMGQKSVRTTHLDYVEVPVLLVGNITETLSIHLGAQASVLTSAYNGTQQLNLDNSGYNRFDFGGIVGAEARLGFARLGARYDLSFANIYKDGSSITYNGHPLPALVTDNNIRNQVVQVYLGIGIAH